MNPKKELSTLRYRVESAAADVREQRQSVEHARKDLALAEEGFEHARGENFANFC
jgi:outer membrane protein TolC